MNIDQLDDPALETLFLPFASGQVTWPEEGVLFLRARNGWPIHAQPRPGLICEQSFKPEADALQRAGLTLNADVDASSDADADNTKTYPLVLILPPRQRDEARALLARAISQVKPGGRVMVCLANNEGARSSEADIEKLVGAVHTLTKNKCRVFWSEPLHEVGRDAVNAALLMEWRELDAVRAIEHGRFQSRPGVFAWDRIDIASALLAKHLPNTLAGDAADLGAGFGYLSAELLDRCAGIKMLDVYEAEQRALALARLNLSSYESRAAIKYYWHDVTVGLRRTYDVIVSNPPFHTQTRADRPDIGRRFIISAAQSLNPDGQLWLVANRHLPYEQILNDSFGKVHIVAEQQGFKIVVAIKARPVVTRTKSRA